MSSIINASTAGIVEAADSSGTLQIQTNGTPAIYVDGSQNVTVQSNLNVNGTLTTSSKISSSNISYNEGGTGAVTTTVQAKLQETVSVKDFGAAGNGSTDDTAAIQAAITSLATTGGTVYFPSGTYKVSSTLSWSTNNITLAGAGKGATTISTYIATGDIISISNAARGGVRDISITASTTQTSGAGIHFTNCDNVRATNILVGYGLYTGIQIDGGSAMFENYVDNFEISTCTFGIAIGVSGVAPQDIFISTGVIGSCSNSGIFMYQGSGIYVNNVDIISSGKGVTTYPASGQTVTDCFFDTVLADTCSNVGWSFFSNGGIVEQVNMVNCWGSTNTLHGMELAAQCNAFSITNFRAINNKQNGIYIQGSTNIGLVNCQVLANSMQGSNLYAGLAIDGSSSDITVIGGKYGAGWEEAGYNYQSYGIVVGSGTINHYAIIGADVNGNVTGGINDLGTGSDKFVTSNPGMPGGGGGGSGTVTSVGVSAGTTRLAVSGSPVTTSGTIALSTTDGFPLVTQADSTAAASNIATFNNAGGTQIADCGISVGSGYIQPPSGMSLGTSSSGWGAFYLSSNIHWNGYNISAPSGTSTTYLSNAGTWTNPTSGFLSASNTFTGSANTFSDTGGIYVGGSTTTTSMRVGYNGGAINFYNSTVGSNVNTSMYFQATSTALTNQAFVLDYNNPTGNVATPAYYFYGDGTAQKTGGGSWTSISDSRLKDNVTPLQGSLAKIASLNPVTYTWKMNTNEPTVGFIAQEVQAILPNAVTSHTPTDKEAQFVSDETLSIGWQNDMTAYLVGAIKELNTIISAQAIEISNLKAKVGI